MVMINSFRYPESTVRYEQRNIRAILDKKDLGLGTLFVSERTLCWQEKGSFGFSIHYHNVTLHAIARDDLGNESLLLPKDCVYVMLDGMFYMPGDAPQTIEREEEEGDSDEEVSEISELLLVPNEEDASSVRARVMSIYDAIRICQGLNPDPQDMDEDDDENIFADAEGELEEGHYVIQDTGAGDEDMDDLSKRMEENLNVNYIQNGNEEDEFQDAD
ncbi:methylosome subunit pICln [Euwallacea fornicatus]|uniref:methylosome subunit pICln n=1 Tax=Euwallacea fornicatus TaxID=995702 RepID=UPI00338F2F07